VTAHAAIIPAAILVVPLILEHLAHELELELARALANALAVHGHGRELRRLAFGDGAEIVALELEAVIKVAVRNRHGDPALDRAAAFFVERHPDIGRKRQRRVELLVERQIERGLALGVGGDGRYLLALRIEALLRE